ncbi:MAG: VWA domain-containing protein [Magnetococcales bacterium]|nr:VWA domain-containing protein [Magnetococcales bacterium]
MSAFHWLRPGWLLALLLLIPLWWWLRGRLESGQGNDWSAACDPHLLRRLLRQTATTATGRHGPHLVILAAALTMLAMAGPAWQKLPQPVFQRQSAWVVVLDLSRSMDATDIQPSRLERARLKIADLIKRRREGSTALIVFAGEAFAVTPLTTDGETILAQLHELTTEIMPMQGSRPDLGLAMAERMLAQAGLTSGTVLLITDGELAPATLEKTRHLRQKGHRLSVLAAGTESGAPVRIKGGGFLQDSQGAIVMPRLNEAPLRELTREGAGQYARLSNDDADLDQLLAEDELDRLHEQPTRTSQSADLWHEEGPWLLLPVILLVLPAFRRGVLMFGLLLTPLAAQADSLSSPWQRPDQAAHEKFLADDFQSAAEGFTDPAWKGAALYKSGRFAEALQALEPLDSADAWYNKGNALARLNRLDEAISAYDQALQRDPKHEDARHNRELVKKQQPPKPPESRPQEQKQEEGSKDPKDSEQKDDQDGPTGKNPEKGAEEPKNGARESKPGEEKGDSQAQKDPLTELSKDKEESSSPPQPPQPDPTQGNPPQPTDRESPRVADQEMNEAQQADEQWLRRIPDDPGGLLRRKFLYQYQRQGQSRREANPW